ELRVSVTGTGPSTLSVAVAVKLTVAPKEPVASATMLAGSESTGGVASVMARENEVEAVAPPLETALTVTVEGPTGAFASAVYVQLQAPGVRYFCTTPLDHEAM